MEERKQLIVAATAGANAADNGYLCELLDGIKSNKGRQPGRGLADAGYQSGCYAGLLGRRQ